MMKMRINHILSLGVLIFAIVFTITAYASASATLYSNESFKSTACIGNTSGGHGFYYWGNVGVTSQYNVVYALYDGKDSDNCNNLIESNAYEPGDVISNTYKQSSKSVGRLIMYGNTISNPLPQCVASGTISAY